MLTLEKAVEILRDSAEPVQDKERIPLIEASGRVLAENITAPMDQPPFPRSPLDGYAVRGEDTLSASRECPVTLEVIGKIYAGEVFNGKVEKGQCVRLMTGAPIPEGADTVIRQEDTDYGEARKANLVRIFRGSEPWKNYCYAGEDYKKGDILLRAGTVLNGDRIGIAAGSGDDMVTVYREPRISVISTGDEVISPGEPIKPGKIYDSNRYLLAGRLGDLGLRKINSSHCPDCIGDMCERIREAAKTSDLIITTGGVSVGEKDIMHGVMEELGAEKLFWKISLKPGSPTLAFTIERKKTGSFSGSDRISVICLTGNPYGVAVNFELLVRPVMEKITGNSAWLCPKRLCLLENDSPKRGGIRRFMRGSFTEGRVRILTGSHASGTLSSMADCSCLVEIGEGSSGKAGEEVWTYIL